jgi:hypothetical protein
MLSIGGTNMLKITVIVHSPDDTDSVRTKRTMEGIEEGATFYEQSLGNMIMDVLKVICEPDTEDPDIQRLLKRIWLKYSARN